MSNQQGHQGGSLGGMTRMSLDTMAEFQVLTHQYGAEYGGASGVVVNAVSRSRHQPASTAARSSTSRTTS